MPRTEDTAAAGSKLNHMPDTSELRARLIEVHHLKESVAWEKALRDEHPELWQKVDAARIERNQMKKLQRMQARNRAELASSEKSR